MFDIRTVESSRLKEVAAPFSMDVMREFFMDKSKIFVVDYGQSQLKGKSLLIYLSNLEIPCEIRFSPEVTLAEKHEMLRCYIESRNLFSIPSFTRAFAKLLLMQKEISTLGSFGEAILAREELKDFLAQNPEAVRRSVEFCDNLPLYAISTTRAYRERFTEPQSVEVIDDPFYVGQNVVDLFYLESFFEIYFSEPPKTRPTFFKRQFRDQMFRGKSLFHYFSNPNNTMMGMLMMIAENKNEGASLERMLSV